MLREPFYGVTLEGGFFPPTWSGLSCLAFAPAAAFAGAAFVGARLGGIIRWKYRCYMCKERRYMMTNLKEEDN